MKRRSPIRRESAKHKAKRIEVEQFRRAYLRAHPECEIGVILEWSGAPEAVHCHKRSRELHERKKRSRGGALDDPDNVLATCRPCHDFTEAWPHRATELGLLLSAWGGG